EMVMIPAGRFLMGALPEEKKPIPGDYSDEWPQHLVTIAKPFAAGRFAVTAAEYRACLADGGCESEKRPPRPASRKPANMSWLAAKDYVRWLSAKTGRRYRLLTEAELEYIIRAGTTTPYPTGDTLRHDQALFYEDREPIEVGSYPPNAFGLYDTIGNLGSWAEDCWHDDYVGAPADGSAWLTGNCKLRARRGGGSRSDRDDLRSAVRDAWRFTDHASGLRVARDLGPPPETTAEQRRRDDCEAGVKSRFVRDGDEVAKEKQAYEDAKAETLRLTFESWDATGAMVGGFVAAFAARKSGDKANEQEFTELARTLQADAKKADAEKEAAAEREKSALSALLAANQRALERRIAQDCGAENN
ncbi:formylglycine-generating enzyme family protein, partial [Rhodomicrobium vannielii ATCC 17100]|uniref:formylglycine-generating enzyme family protein n=1 Tax=Rhodomicrobium vannielii TaxID=1069 RepID=UPI0019189867